MGITILSAASVATETSSEAAYVAGTCSVIPNDQIILPRTTFIVAITLCLFITCLSLLGLAVLIYREWDRKQQNQAAKSWARQTRLGRISLARKEIDAQYSRQFSGCLYNDTDNPFATSDSPVELEHHQRVFEAPSVPVAAADRHKRRSKAISLFWDQTVGIWIPKR